MILEKYANKNLPEINHADTEIFKTHNHDCVLLINIGALALKANT